MRRARKGTEVAALERAIGGAFETLTGCGPTLQVAGTVAGPKEGLEAPEVWLW